VIELLLRPSGGARRERDPSSGRAAGASAAPLPSSRPTGA